MKILLYAIVCMRQDFWQEVEKQMGKTKLRKTAMGNMVNTDSETQTEIKTPKVCYEKAVWWKCLVAYAIDLAIYSIVAFIFVLSMQVYAVEGEQTYSMFMMLCLAISSVYLSAVLPKFVPGQTVGRIIMKIRLDATKKPLSYWRYFLREFMAKISMVIVLIPMSVLYGGIEWFRKKERPTTIMLDELFHTTTVDLTKPISTQK
ncbi:MAG: RDD family protein [Culicoidibacterales bacterium]